MSDLRQEIGNRRTFAIISHPDAGKTTITEKFLLYGGAIQEAGMVKGKKNSRHAVSDWMEIEKQRGISVTSSVLQFRYGDKCQKAAYFRAFSEVGNRSLTLEKARLFYMETYLPRNLCQVVTSD